MDIVRTTLALTLGLFGSLNATAQAPYPDLLYYKFDEGSGSLTANLASPGVGAAQATVNGQTLAPSGGQFNGSLVGVGGNSPTNSVDTGWATQLSGDFTISFWLDLTNVASTNPFMYVLGDNTANSFRCFTNGVAGTNGIVLKQVSGFTGLIIPGGSEQSAPHHVAWVYNSSTAEVRGFLDGVFVSSAPQVAVPITGTGPFRVGGYATVTGLIAGGVMDEIRVYSSALSDAEIAATWNVSLSPGGSTTVYCTAGTTTNGCVPSISATGTASASAASGFNLDVVALEGQKQALLFYGVDNTGFAPLAWGQSSSFLCVKAPTQRSIAQNTGGTAGTCSGTFSMDWNAFRAATPGALGQPFAAGDSVYAQVWFRDPPTPKTTMLSDALQFTLAP